MATPTHVYLDLDVRNDDVETVSSPPPLNFDETRLHPFLNGDASDYFCTIARFTLDTSNSIPVFIPEIDTNQTGPTKNVNKTIYKISFKKILTGGQVLPNGPITAGNVIYTRSDETVQPPSFPDKVDDPSSTYYHVHSYQHVIDMINTVLVFLYNKIIPYGGAHYNPPYMEWDNNTYTASINVDPQTFDTTPSNQFLGNGFQSAGNDRYDIYFNTRLYQLFNTLPATFVNATGDLNYRLDIFGKPNNTTRLNVNDGNGEPMHLINMPQEISTISNMSPLDSIVFTSTSLPIHPSLSSAPKVISSTNKSSSSNGLPNITNVLTDFQIALSATNHYKPVIAYAPQGEYRLIDMYGNKDLSRIDLQVYWKDKKGVLHPMLLHPGCSASVKFLFRHRRFYLGD